FIDGFSGHREGGLRRKCTRIGGIEVAARRQHVEPATRGRTCWTRRNVASVKCREKRPTLRLGANLAALVRTARIAAPKNMQPVLDGGVLEIAKPGIDPHQRGVGIIRLANARLAGQSASSGSLDDQ